MLKLFGGGGGGNGEGKTWHGKSFRIERYHVTVEDVLAEGTVHGCLSVWGELVNHKRSLTHRPSSQGWAPKCPIHLCLFGYSIVRWFRFPSFFSSSAISVM